MNAFIRVTLVLGLTFLLPAFAFAATQVVDDDGAQCAGAPFTTITAALAAANATGDTIQVCDGTYAEGTIFVTKEVVIDGVNRDATFVNVVASGVYGFHVQADNVTISDLVIQQVGAGITSSAGIRYDLPTSLDNDVVSNVIIRDFLGGSARGINIETTVNDLTITNTTFSNNLYGIRMASNSHTDGLFVSGSAFSAPLNTGDFSRAGIYGPNDGNTSSLRDLQATGNSFTNFSFGGIYVEEMQDSVISGNQFTGNWAGVFLDKRYLNGGRDVHGVEVSGNTFTNQTGPAVTFTALLVGLGPGMVVSGNTINVNVGILYDARGAIVTSLASALTHSPVSIRDNTLTFSGAFGTVTSTWGVQLAGDGPIVIEGNAFDGNDIISSGTPPFAAIYIVANSASRGQRNDPVTIECNDITDFVHGITVYDPVAAQGGNLAAGTMVNVHSNNIVSNSLFGIFNGTTAGASATIDANGNWWGAPSGPSGAGPGSGDAISANVLATTFLTGPVTDCTELSITKTDAPDPVAPSQQLTYTIIVTNSGAGSATGVVVNDTLPASLTNIVTSGCAEDPSGGAVCTLGTISGGASAAYTITGTVSPDAPSTLTNTATLSATGIPADAFNDTATTQTAVTLGADLDIEKTLLTAGAVNPGQIIVFRLDVTNNGPSNATGVVATDVLPAGLQFVDSACATAAGNTVTWTIGSLAVGATVSCEFRARVTQSGPISNTATVSGAPADPGGADSDTVTIVAVAAVNDVPTIGMTGLLLLGALLAMAGIWAMTRVS